MGSEKNKIPKVIHYCWFGGNPLTEMSIKCIESWKKYCPDYEIIEWNENNFDININAYTKEAYENKKWAFVSDVARLYALVNVGGIYMDTDVELTKPLDGLLKHEAFSGFESETRIPTGIMGCMKGQKLFVELLNYYNDKHFIKEDGSLDTTTNVVIITDIVKKYGLNQNNTFQTVNGFTLFPNDYFCPKNWETRELNITENTHCIHHFDGSWLSDEDRYMENLKFKLVKFMGVSIAGYTAKLMAVLKYRGVAGAFKETWKWIVRKR